MTTSKGDMDVHYSSDRQDWETPQGFFDELDAEFGIQLDVCATAETAKCSAYFDEDEDALSFSWIDEPVLGQMQFVFWMNPPYGWEISKWVKKAYEEAQKGAKVICLIPYRPDTRYWFDYIWEPQAGETITYATRPRKGVEVRAIKGRLKFDGHKNSAPFPSAIVIFDNPA